MRPMPNVLARISICAACLLVPSAVRGEVRIEILNGSMTDGTNMPSNWQGSSEFTTVRDTDTYKIGPASIRMDLKTVTAGNVTQDLATAPGQTVEITGWTKSQASGDELEQYQVAILTTDENHQKIDWHQLMMRIKWRESMTHDWTEFRGKAQISDKTRHMILIIFLKGKGTVWVDELRVVGSGGGAATGASSREDAPAKDRRGDGTYFLRASDTVLVVGDAVSAEGGVYRLALEEDLKAEYPDLAAAKSPKLVNAATAGATAASVSRMLPGLLDRHRPTVAVVCCGVNDSFMDTHGFATGMRAIVRTLKERSVAVTLLTPPHIDASKHPELAERSRALDEMVGQLRRLAADERVPLADCHGKMKEHLARGGGPLDWGDGVHPNARGKRMMADALQSAWGFGEPLGK